MCFVVEKDVHKVRWSRCADGRHGAHVHQGCAIAVDAENTALRSVQGDTERDCTRVSHRTNREEIVCMILSAAGAQLKEFPPRLARCCNNDGILCRIENRINGLLAAQREFVCVFSFGIGERPLTDKKGALPA